MVSSKERQRLGRMFDDMKARMDRQAASITRLVAENVAMSAALQEITILEPHGDEWDDAAAFKAAQEIAKSCLTTVNARRAGAVDSTEAQTPTGDENAEERQDDPGSTD